MNQINHFEIPAKDGKKAADWYSNLFGWNVSFDNEVGYGFIATGPVNNEGMPTGPGYIGGGFTEFNEAVKGPVLVVTVEDVRAKLTEINNNGGKTLVEPVTIPNMGEYALFRDPEGNTLGLWQAAGGE